MNDEEVYVFEIHGEIEVFATSEREAEEQLTESLMDLLTEKNATVRLQIK
jgi:hypothetical protein